MAVFQGGIQLFSLSRQISDIDFNLPRPLGQITNYNL